MDHTLLLEALLRRNGIVRAGIVGQLCMDETILGIAVEAFFAGRKSFARIWSVRQYAEHALTILTQQIFFTACMI